MPEQGLVSFSSHHATPLELTGVPALPSGRMRVQAKENLQGYMRSFSHSAADSRLTFAQAWYQLPSVSSHVGERSTPVHFDAQLLHEGNVLLVSVEEVVRCVPGGIAPDLARHLDKGVPYRWALACPVDRTLDLSLSRCVCVARQGGG